MTTVYANVPIDLLLPNLNELVAGSATFLANANLTSRLGNVYPDAWRVVSTGSPLERSTLFGVGFTVGANLALTGGTVRGLQQEVWTGSAWAAGWGMEGFSIAATALYGAAASPGIGDDIGIVATVLAGADRFRLSEGTDRVHGFGGNDTLLGMGGADLLFGDDGNDSIDGGAGNDQILGNAGADTMLGGTGSDDFVVDHLGDRVIETSTLAAEIDTVRSTVSFTLGPNIERLVLDGSAASGTGNAGANQISGNAAANLLTGNGGDDRLDGFDGADTLVGGSGNDSLIGGTGSDSMVGGTGRDTYVVERSGDRVVETSTLATETDTVNASVGYTLPANVEILFLVGSAVAGTGNALANRIYGNAAANRLSGLGGDDSLLGSAGADTLAGGSGIDTLEGGTGNDVYVVANRTDVVVETSTLATEVDRVESTVSWTLGPNLERLTLLGSTAIDGTGNTRANVLVGNVAINRLAGGAGNDRIDGRAGNDSLTGGSGLDAFLFSTAPGATNIDRLADFNPADDRILLDDAVFAALAPGALPAAAFHDRAVATEAAHRILYDEVGGRLLYDADGAGGVAAVVFATLAPNLAVGAADFFVV